MFLELNTMITYIIKLLKVYLLFVWVFLKLPTHTQVDRHVCYY